jgi:hypothetical protein
MVGKTIIAAFTLWFTFSGSSFAQTYKYQTPIAPGIAVPDKIESSIGTLKLRYGYPEADTVEKIRQACEIQFASSDPTIRPTLSGKIWSMPAP